MAITRKRSFKTRIFLTYLAAFSIFTVSIYFFQYDREKKYRAAQLENTLENITSFTHNFIEKNQLLEQNNIQSLDSLMQILPLNNERITVINDKGVVLYDSEVKDVSKMENHLQRQEVQKSLYSGKGSSIRNSATTGNSYYYFSISYDHYFIRTAVLYDLEIKGFLKTERFFIFFLLALFVIMWLILQQITKRIGNFLSELQDIAVSAEIGAEIENIPDFPDRELDVISKKIVSIYNKLNKAKESLQLEKTKLFDHMNVLAEGIAIYSKRDELKLSNKHFIHYLSMISDKTFVSVADIKEIEAMNEVLKFIDTKRKEGNISEAPEFTKVINKGEQYFQVKAIVFVDKSYEILISDITKLEKRRLLKQQLTSNIAHELKTPVTSIRGYLETMLNNENIEAEKKQHFMQRAYDQVERLTELLNDISLINNIEDAAELFEFQNIQISSVVSDVIDNLKMNLDDRKIKHFVDIPETVKIYGNQSLLSSVFQNLIENTIKYAGENIEIIIRNYHEDEKNYYFSYVDSGKGIPEDHLPRIFERFYRIDEGRSRQKGGSGLGLSIVKNAIQLHKGEISVHNRVEGGIEFLFSLSKVRNAE